MTDKTDKLSLFWKFFSKASEGPLHAYENYAVLSLGDSKYSFAKVYPGFEIEVSEAVVAQANNDAAFIAVAWNMSYSFWEIARQLSSVEDPFRHGGQGEDGPCFVCRKNPHGEFCAWVRARELAGK